MKYIDLFSGCGGLSLGLDNAGFKNYLSIEKSPMAAETFYHNFISRIEGKEWDEYLLLNINEQFEKGLIVNDLETVLNSNKIMNKIKQQKIDLVAGGPPCQGFSLAGQRNPEDHRNQLSWQFLTFVEKTNPKTVIIENVAGFRQNFKKHNKKSPFEELIYALENTGKGYHVQPLHLNAMHYGVPQHRPRTLLIGIRKNIISKNQIKLFNPIWKSEYDQTMSNQRPSLAPPSTHFDHHILTTENALSDIYKYGYKFGISDSFYKSKKGRYANQMRRIKTNNFGNIKYKLKNHNIRSHTDRVIERFKLYHFFRDMNVSSNFLNVVAHYNIDASDMLKIMSFMRIDINFPIISNDNTILAKNKIELAKLVVKMKTKKNSQRALCLNKPSPTLMSLPDDYVHPVEPRALTVREMARIQSFPDSFEFKAKEITGGKLRRTEIAQFTQVANAVPPVMAKAIGKNLINLLRI